MRDQHREGSHCQWWTWAVRTGLFPLPHWKLTTSVLYSPTKLLSKDVLLCWDTQECLKKISITWVMKLIQISVCHTPHHNSEHFLEEVSTWGWGFGAPSSVVIPSVWSLAQSEFSCAWQCVRTRPWSDATTDGQTVTSPFLLLGSTGEVCAV